MEYTKRICSTINEDGGVLKTGFVLGGFAPIKSKKLLFAVLTDRALNLFENEKTFKRKPKNPKHVVDLSTAFNVQRDHFDAKLRHCVCLMGPDDTFAFKIEKPANPLELIPEEHLLWFQAILQALLPSRALRLGRPVTLDEFFEFCWDIEVVAEPKLKKPLDPADRLPTMCGRKDGIEAGPRRLCFYPHTIVLCKRRVEPTVHGAPSSNCPPFNCDDFFEIQRNFVAFFGSHERFFVIKMGRGSPCGACELWLSMDSEDVANDVHVKLSYIIERESEKKKKAIGETLVSNPPITRNPHRDRSQTQPAQMRAANGHETPSVASKGSVKGPPPPPKPESKTKPLVSVSKTPPPPPAPPSTPQNRRLVLSENLREKRAMVASFEEDSGNRLQAPQVGATAALHRPRGSLGNSSALELLGRRLCSPASSTSWIGRKSSGASMTGSLTSRCNTMSTSGSPVKSVKNNGNYVINYITTPVPAPTVTPTPTSVKDYAEATPSTANYAEANSSSITTANYAEATANGSGIATANYAETNGSGITSANYAEATVSYAESTANGSVMTTANYAKDTANGSLIITANVNTKANGSANTNGNGDYCTSYNYSSIPIAIASASSNTATISSTASSGSGGAAPKPVWGVFPPNRRASNSSSIFEEQVYQSMDCMPEPTPPPQPMESVSTNGSVHDETEDSGGTLRLEGEEEDKENYAETKDLPAPTERRSKVGIWLDDVSDNDERSSVSGISGASVASSSGMPEEYAAMEHDFPFGSNNQLIVPTYDRFHSNMDDMKHVSDSTDSCYSSMATNGSTVNSGVVNTPRAYSFGGRGQLKPSVAAGDDGDSKDNGSNLGLPAEDPRKRAFSLGSKIFLPRPFRKNANCPNRQQRHSQTSASGVSLASSAGSSFGPNSSSSTQLATEPQAEEAVRQRSGSFGSGKSSSYVQKDDQPIGDSHHVAMDFSGRSCSGSMASIDSASRSRTSSMGCSRKEDYAQHPAEVPAQSDKSNDQISPRKPNAKSEETPPADQSSFSGCTSSVAPEEVVLRTPEQTVRRMPEETKEARKSQFLEEPVLETVNESPESRKSAEDEKPVVNNIRPLFSETRSNGKSVEKLPNRVVEKTAVSSKLAEKSGEKPASISLFAKAVSLISSSTQREKPSIAVNGSSVEQPKQTAHSSSNSKTAGKSEQAGNSSNLAKVVEKSLISNLGKALEKAKKKTVAPNLTPFEKMEKAAIASSKEKLANSSKHSNPFSSVLEKSSSQKAIDRASVAANYATVEQPSILLKPLEKSASQPKVVEFPTNYMTVDVPSKRKQPIDYAMMDVSPSLSASSENIHSTRPDRSASSPVREALSTPNVIPKRASVPTMRNEAREDSVLNYASLEINRDDVVKPGSVPTNAYLTSFSKPGINCPPQQETVTDYASIM